MVGRKIVDDSPTQTFTQVTVRLRWWREAVFRSEVDIMVRGVEGSLIVHLDGDDNIWCYNSREWKTFHKEIVTVR